MQVKIGPLVYDVDVVELLKTPDGKDLFGQIDHAEARIDVNAGNTSDMAMLTLWHEVIHGIEFVYGLEELTELQIRGLATGVVMALVDNPILRGGE